MLYILWGEDQFSLGEALQEIKRGLGDVSLLSTNTSVLEGQKLTLNELKAAGETMPFLAPRRLVIIKGLLERFEPKEKSVRTKKGTGVPGKQDETAHSLATCIRNLPPTTVLVLSDVIEVRKSSLQNNSLFLALAAQADVRSFPLMKGVKLLQWIQARVSSQSAGISRSAADMMIQTVGGDLFTMSNEINKLVAFTGGRMIEEKDIRLVVSASQEADIFALIDAVLDCKAGLAEQILQKLLRNGVVAPQILALLARQVRMLFQIIELKGQKRPAAEIQSKVGIFNPYAWDRMSGRAGKYSLERLKMIYRKLLETDLSIKTGRLDSDLAVDILAADLCEMSS